MALPSGLPYVGFGMGGQLPLIPPTTVGGRRRLVASSNRPGIGPIIDDPEIAQEVQDFPELRTLGTFTRQLGEIPPIDLQDTGIPPEEDAINRPDPQSIPLISAIESGYADKKVMTPVEQIREGIRIGDMDEVEKGRQKLTAALGGGMNFGQRFADAYLKTGIMAGHQKIASDVVMNEMLRPRAVEAVQAGLMSPSELLPGEQTAPQVEGPFIPAQPQAPLAPPSPIEYAVRPEARLTQLQQDVIETRQKAIAQAAARARPPAVHTTTGDLQAMMVELKTRKKAGTLPKELDPQLEALEETLSQVKQYAEDDPRKQAVLDRTAQGWARIGLQAQLNSHRQDLMDARKALLEMEKKGTTPDLALRKRALDVQEAKLAFTMDYVMRKGLSDELGYEMLQSLERDMAGLAGFMSPVLAEDTPLGKRWRQYLPSSLGGKQAPQPVPGARFGKTPPKQAAPQPQEVDAEKLRKEAEAELGSPLKEGEGFTDESTGISYRIIGGKTVKEQ